MSNNNMEEEEEGLQSAANYMALSPIYFLERAAIEYGDTTSIIYGKLRFTWKQTHHRCLNLASALIHYGISRHHVVVALAPNVPALYELHFGVPMAGAILSALNIKLDSPTLALILQQLDPKIIFVDHQYVELIHKALDMLINQTKSNPPLLILIPDSDSNHYNQTTSSHHNHMINYNDLLTKSKSDDFEIIWPKNECDPISINYTSGSTGIPKGVIYSHRATYLNSISAIFNLNSTSENIKENIPNSVIFLWTVDMFRCNGWCYTWAIAAIGGTNVCVRNNFSSKVIFEAISLHKVTHFCGKPTLLNIISEASFSIDMNLSQLLLPSRKVNVIVAGQLPAPEIVMKVIELGFSVSYGYGMTEALGPVFITEWKTELGHYLKIRSGKLGVNNVIVDLKDPNTMKSVPFDGKTVGEIMLKGNTLMLGYLKNPKANQEAFKDGWYRSGDIGIRYPDGYIQMKDRAEDIIVINYDENHKVISSLEVEDVLLRFPKVLEAAVVGKSDGNLGMIVCAFVRLKEGSFVTSQEIKVFCRNHLPSHMVPFEVIFGDLPVTSTGKVQKFVLRKKLANDVLCRNTNGVSNGNKL